MQTTHPQEDFLLEVKNVTMKFTKYDVRVDALKELVVRAFRSDMKREKFECLLDVSFKIKRGESVAV